jgi:hypothetical protein
MNLIRLRSNRAGYNMRSVMTVLSKYIATIFLFWLGTFSASFFGNNSILQGISLLVGVVLGLLSIVSKVWELLKRYRRQTIREEIERIIQNKEMKSDTEDALRDIANDQE